jgi:hypothetical protein
MPSEESYREKSKEVFYAKRTPGFVEHCKKNGWRENRYTSDPNDYTIYYDRECTREYTQVPGWCTKAGIYSPYKPGCKYYKSYGRLLRLEWIDEEEETDEQL